MRRIYQFHMNDSKANTNFSKWQWVEVEAYPNTQDIRKKAEKYILIG